MTIRSQTVRVDLPRGDVDRSYDVVVGAGLLDELGARLLPMLRRPYAAVVADANVVAAHGPRIAAALDAAGVRHDLVTLPPGEATKSPGELSTLLSRLLALGVERTDVVVAFGGGVVGDLVGLAASLLRRGCRFVQAPTTLLAQVDSSVGGKTAINAAEGKNLIGAFHQPSLVLADVDLLATLPLRELRAGYAEVVKYAALGDRAFFGWLDQHGAALLAGDPQAAVHAVRTSVAAKAAIVARDETETGERRLLNLGHTFGHALEAAYGYSGALLHGEAVAAGMGLAFDYSVARGLCTAGDAAALKRHLHNAGLPAGLADLPPTDADISADALVAGMRQDKKMAAGRLALILARGIGAAFVEPDADLSDVHRFLAEDGRRLEGARAAPPSNQSISPRQSDAKPK